MLWLNIHDNYIESPHIQNQVSVSDSSMYSSCYSSVVAMQQVRIWINEKKLTMENLKKISKLVDIDELLGDILLFIKAPSTPSDEKKFWVQAYEELDKVSEVYSIDGNIIMETSDPDIDDLWKRLMMLKFKKEVLPVYTLDPEYVSKYDNYDDCDDCDDCSGADMDDCTPTECADTTMCQQKQFKETWEIGDDRRSDELTHYEDAGLDMNYSALVSGTK